jgi:hypothetical protein
LIEIGAPLDQEKSFLELRLSQLEVSFDQYLFMRLLAFSCPSPGELTKVSQ